MEKIGKVQRECYHSGLMIIFLPFMKLRYDINICIKDSIDFE